MAELIREQQQRGAKCNKNVVLLAAKCAKLQQRMQIASRDVVKRVRVRGRVSGSGRAGPE